MVMRHIRMLTRYSAWADRTLFDSLAAIPEEELLSIRSHGAGSILKVLNHSRVVDHIWQSHLKGVPHGYTSRNTEVLPPFRDIVADQTALDRWYVDYSDGLGETGYDEVVDFRFVDGGCGSMTRGEMLLHVINHKTYHRGYVAEMLYQAGLRPPTMDLPVFLRDRNPDQP